MWGGPFLSSWFDNVVVKFGRFSKQPFVAAVLLCKGGTYHLSACSVIVFPFLRPDAPKFSSLWRGGQLSNDLLLPLGLAFSSFSVLHTT